MKNGRAHFKIPYVWNPEADPDTASNFNGEVWSTHTGDSEDYKFYWEKPQGQITKDVYWKDVYDPNRILRKRYSAIIAVIL